MDDHRKDCNLLLKHIDLWLLNNSSLFLYRNWVCLVQTISYQERILARGEEHQYQPFMMQRLTLVQITALCLKLQETDRMDPRFPERISPTSLKLSPCSRTPKPSSPGSSRWPHRPTEPGSVASTSSHIMI